jgi:NDP-sugar pyrophosphorylase family protein
MKPELLRELNEPDHQELYLASMGIYVFNRKLLEECLNNDLPDFGKNIIPSIIGTSNVHAYIHRGYWEDIGTIRSFFDAISTSAILIRSIISIPGSAHLHGAPLPTRQRGGGDGGAPGHDF